MNIENVNILDAVSGGRKKRPESLVAAIASMETGIGRLEIERDEAQRKLNSYKASDDYGSAITSGRIAELQNERDCALWQLTIMQYGIDKLRKALLERRRGF